MQKCSICDKAIYGHPSPSSTKKRVNGVLVMENGPVVCGSCPLNKSEGARTGRSFSAVRMDLVKIVTRETPERLDSVVTDILVKSNVRNRTILLDGRYAVVFDENGLGKLPAQHKALFDREMMMKPGRFSFVEEPVLEVVEAVEVEVPIEAVEVPVEPLVVEEETVDPVDDVPAGLDQSFLVEEVQSPVKKASKKK